MRASGALLLLLLAAAADESLLRATIELDGETRVDVTSPSLGAARASAARFCELLGHNATVDADGGAPGAAAAAPTCTDAVTRALVRSSPEARDPSASAQVVRRGGGYDPGLRDDPGLSLIPQMSLLARFAQVEISDGFGRRRGQAGGGRKGA